MADGLAYDMMLEVHGVIRSQTLRVKLDRELGLGETFDMNGRLWMVTRVRDAKPEDLDRRLVAREVDRSG